VLVVGATRNAAEVAHHHTDALEVAVTFTQLFLYALEGLVDAGQDLGKRSRLVRHVKSLADAGNAPIDERHVGHRKPERVIDFVSNACGDHSDQREAFRFVEPLCKLSSISFQQHPTDRRDEVARLEWLRNVAVGTYRGSLGAFVRGDRDDGDLGNRRVGRLGGDELPAIHHRHHEVEYDGIRGIAPQVIESLLAVDACVDAIARFFENRRHGVQDVFVVFDDENTPVGRDTERADCLVRSHGATFPRA
jgi:hypothetical protein